MNSEDMYFLKELRKLEENQRFSTIIENFPRTSKSITRALRLVCHCSWSRKNQINLFNYYGPLFHGDQIGYLIKCFSYIMSKKILAKLIWEITEGNEKDRYFAKLHLKMAGIDLNQEYKYFKLWNEWNESEYIQNEFKKIKQI